MELYQLRSFARTARIGNLTRAAAELNLTQPAVSQQIRALEADLGGRLFERQGRGLRLTEAGRLFLSRAEAILALADDARHEVEALDGLASGTLKIGTNDSNCLYVLPEVIAGFRRDYPGVRILMDNGHSTQVCRWVAEGAAEIGIVTLPAAEAGLEAEHLYARKDVLVFPPAHPLAEAAEIGPAGIAQYPLLLLHGGSISHSRLLGTLSEASSGDLQIMRVGSIDVIKQYVEAGMGISVIPQLNAAREIDAGRLLARSLPWLPESAVGAVYRNSGYLSPAARTFLERLRRHVQETLS